MASYHFSVKDKPKGYASSHYLYISRLEIYQHVRSKSEEVLECVVAGRCMPSWASDPTAFWQAADAHERANAKSYMEYEFALPNEFTAEQRQTLVETFLSETVAKQQYPHSYAIHNVKSRISGEDQPHCHLMFSLRADDGVERTCEQYFKRFNRKDPSKGGARKKQLQEGFDNFSDFLMHIRKKWEDVLNVALQKYAPTISYELDGQSITVLNRVSASSYESYNLKHGTLYLPEPKLGVGQQNHSEAYLAQIKLIREHNAKEQEMEVRQQQKEHRAEQVLLYAIDDQPYTTPEVSYLIQQSDSIPDHEISSIRQQQHQVEQIYAGQSLKSAFNHQKNVKPNDGFEFSM